ncbi:MAG TPA: hypothetical protein VGK73_15395, partial [Polyangiaceae bacterium]
LRAIRTLPRAELERYRREAIATAVLRELGNLENPLVIAGRHVSALRHSGQPYRLADRLAALRAVGLDDLERAQRRLAAAKTVVASLVRPPEGTPPIPGGELIETP